MELSYRLRAGACEGNWECPGRQRLCAIVGDGPERATVVQSSAPGLAKTGAASAVSKRGDPDGLVSSILGGRDQGELGLEAERPTAVGALDQEDGRLPLLDDPMDDDALGILPASWS